MFFDGEKATVSNSRVSCIQSSQAAVLSALIFNLLQIKAINLGWGAVWKGFWRRWGVGSVWGVRKLTLCGGFHPSQREPHLGPSCAPGAATNPFGTSSVTAGPGGTNSLSSMWRRNSSLPSSLLRKQGKTELPKWGKTKPWLVKETGRLVSAAEAARCCMASALKSYQGNEQLTKIVKTLWKCTNHPVTHWGGVLPKQVTTIVKYFNKDCVHQGHHGLPNWYS